MLTLATLSSLWLFSGFGEVYQPLPKLITWDSIITGLALYVNKITIKKYEKWSINLSTVFFDKIYKGAC